MAQAPAPRTRARAGMRPSSRNWLDVTTPSSSAPGNDGRTHSAPAATITAGA